MFSDVEHAHITMRVVSNMITNRPDCCLTDRVCWDPQVSLADVTKMCKMVHDQQTRHVLDRSTIDRKDTSFMKTFFP